MVYLPTFTIKNQLGKYTIRGSYGMEQVLHPIWCETEINISNLQLFFSLWGLFFSAPKNSLRNLFWRLEGELNWIHSHTTRESIRSDLSRRTVRSLMRLALGSPTPPRWRSSCLPSWLHDECVSVTIELCCSEDIYCILKICHVRLYFRFYIVHEYPWFPLFHFQVYTTFDTISALNPSMMQSHLLIINLWSFSATQNQWRKWIP